MKKINSYTNFYTGLFIAALLFIAGCKKRDVADLQKPTYPSMGEVFIDDFTGDLAYAAFGGSDVKAFQVDNQVSYGGTKQSMRFEVPDANSPNGSYAGGVFYSKTGRDLSGYNALTFYIKATQPATIGVIGFGNDLGQSKYLVTLKDLPINSNWKKVIIPIPDASKLVGEKGLMYFSTGPENNRGYTFWIDEVRFENLSTIASLTGIIQKGTNDSIPNAIVGDSATITNFQAKVSLPTGVDQTVDISPWYFAFSSSNSSVATVSSTGGAKVVSGGSTFITAKLNGKATVGSLKINSLGSITGPAAPTVNSADVISVLSRVYNDVPVDYFNGYWQPHQTTLSDMTVAGTDTIVRYRNLNFVGIQFTAPTQNVSPMKRFHMDIWTPNTIQPTSSLEIQLVDFGANGVFGGGDDATGTFTIPASKLASQRWISIDTLLSSFTGLTSKGHLAQIVLVGNNLPDLWVDNIYFWRLPVAPVTAAPVPTRAAANVLSLFSDAYTNVAGTDFNPNWGQNTQVTQTPVAGNNTLVYSNFNYQGMQIGSSQNVSTYGFLHLDYYSTNADVLRIFLISPGPVETPYTLTVPTSGWNSVDIPLSAFSPVNLASVFQLKFDAGGNTGSASYNIYFDNIYFWKIPPVPPVAAPVPTYAAGSVISIYSDTYTNVAGTDFYPNWGQSTQYAQVAVAGNNAIQYSNLNYQGIQFGSNQNVSGKAFLHVDYYSANATTLNIYLICPPGSPGGQAPWEKGYALPVPTAAGWNSVDIPLSYFTPIVDLGNTFQFKFDGGNGSQTIYLDNIIFHN